MTNVQLFNFKSNQIRVVEIEGAPWFVAKDVCDVLDLQPKYACGRLAEMEKTYVARSDLGLTPGKPMYVISESGLYRLVMRSDKPEARRFQDWVTKEVLPAIRKG